MRRLVPCMLALLCVSAHGSASAAWTVSASGGARAAADTILPPTDVSIAASCTPTTPETISFVGASSAWSNTTPLTVASPAGVAVGDLLLAHVAHRFTTDLTASGWTVLQHQANGLTQAVFHRYVTDPAASYSFRAATGGNWAVNVVAYRGVDKVVGVAFPGGTVTGVQVAGGQVGNGSTITAPSVTTTSENTRLVGFFGTQPKTTLSSPSPDGTVRVFTQTDGSGADQHHVAVATADRPIGAAGDTGPFSLTAGTTADYVAQVVALKPESFPEATLSWTASASPYATGYELRRLVAGTVQKEALLDSSAPYLDTPLQAGTTYDYELSSRAAEWRSTVVTVQHSAVAC